jgi:hypothetical protein
MPLTALILPLLAAAAQSLDAPADRIVVTGRPWAPFVSPMGEPFRARTTADDTLANWFRQADQNHDGALTVEEMQADAGRFFAALDHDQNREIEPQELVHYEWETAPEIQVNSKTRRAPGEPKPTKAQARQREKNTLQGAARYALLNIPEPVAAADADFDRGITPGEFREAAVTRFRLLDSKGLGRITLAELQAIRLALQTRKRGGDRRDTRHGNRLPPVSKGSN